MSLFLQYAPREVALLLLTVYAPNQPQRVQTPSPAEFEEILTQSEQSRPYAPDKASLFLQGSLDDRIRKAGSYSPTLREAEHLHSYGELWCLFAIYANAMTAFVMPSWDVHPEDASGWVIANITNVNEGWIVSSYIIGESDFSDRAEDEQKGIGQTDINVMVNVKNSSLMPSGRNIPWAKILTEDPDTSYLSIHCDGIFIDLKATFLMLKSRFDIVSPDRSLELAKEWTLKSFRSVCDYIRNADRDLLALFMYLTMNATALNVEINWQTDLWKVDIVMDERRVKRLSEKCEVLIGQITEQIQNLY